MALTELIVTLQERPIGKLTFDGQYYFNYEGPVCPIELSRSLPRNSSEPVFKGSYRELPCYFQHLLPEGWLKEATDKLKIPLENDLERLYLTCRDTFGAVSFALPMTGVPDYLQGLVDGTHSRERIWKSSAGEDAAPSNASLICYFCGKKLPRTGYNQNFHETCSETLFGTIHPPLLDVRRPNLLEIAKVQAANGQTVPGVQAKFSFEYKSNDRTLRIPGFTYIVKPEPEIETLKGMAACEHILMTIAGECGLNVAKSALLRLSDGVPAYIIQRFDRQLALKLHAEDFAQLLNIRNKYNGSYKKIATVILQNSSLPAADIKLEARQLLDVTLLNYIFGNSDAHLKNHAIIRTAQEGFQGGIDRLAPFYDIFPARIFALGDTDDLGLAMGIDVGGKPHTQKDSIDRKVFDAFAEYLGLRSQDITIFLKKIRAKRARLIELLRGYAVPVPVSKRIGEYAANQLQRLEKISSPSADTR